MSLLVDIQKDLGGFRLAAAFEAQDGITGLLGASGCGKSMTLQCIAGILKPDCGHISLDGVTLFDSGKRIDLPPQRRRVGYLFQDYALFPHMTVRQNILCGLRAQTSRAARGQALAQALARMELTGLERRRPAELSGGQQQRVALARILASRPRLLLLDEPFCALDSHLRETLQLEMKALLADYGGPALLVTHSRDEAYRLCARIALMDQGRILAAQPTKQLFADPGSVAAARMTGCTNISAAVKTGEHTLFARDWGVALQSALPLRDGLCAVGVHARCFHEKTMRNRFPVRMGEVVEEPFARIAAFRYAAQPPGQPALWWRFPGEYAPQGPVTALGVAPADVLPLYPA